MRSTVLTLSIVAALFAASAPMAAEPGAKAPMLAGVNIAGGEFKSNQKPGVFFKDYVYPDKKTVEYFADRGMTVIRMPFLWERLQPKLDAALSVVELSRIDAVVNHATARGVHVVLDAHNYGTYSAEPIGSATVPVAAFAGFWKSVADHYKGNQRVIFGLMNEPKSIRADSWALFSQAAVNAIREAGARNLILVPGTYWSGAHSWRTRQQGVSNAEAMEKIKDPTGGPLAFEVHQYLDSDYSGMNEKCQSEAIGAEKLKGFTEWLRKTGSRGFLGEFGTGTSPTCLRALDNMLAYIGENADVWAGWTYWSAGSWWPTTYPFSVQPMAEGTRPQMDILLKHLPKT